LYSSNFNLTRQKRMKKLVAIILLIGFGLVGFSQEDNSYMEVMRSALKTEKKALIAEAMTFTPAESDAFWPLYNEYQEKLYTANTKYIQIINEFAENFETLSDEKAMELMKRLNAYDSEVLKLRKTYMKKFAKILPAKKLLRYFQAENKIDVLIDFEIAASVPMID